MTGEGQIKSTRTRGRMQLALPVYLDREEGESVPGGDLALSERGMFRERGRRRKRGKVESCKIEEGQIGGHGF